MSFLDQFSGKYPDEAMHNVLLSLEDLKVFLNTLEQFHTSLRTEGFKVPAIELYDMDSEKPYLKYVYPDTLKSLDALIVEKEEANGGELTPEDTQWFNTLVEKGNKLAKKVEDAKSIHIMNRNTSNIYFDTETDEVWLFDLRQSTWNDMMRFFFQVQEKKQA